jgi:hypothetical protein
MTTLAYSNLFACLYDQPEAIGSIGRGSHHSVFRSVQWRGIDGSEMKNGRGRIHDFAVIWDEDHDTRVVQVAERLHMAGLLWPVVFIGERKGDLTIILAHEAGSIEHDDPEYVGNVEAIAEGPDDVDSWQVRFGTYQRMSARVESTSTYPGRIIADYDEKVVPYLHAIDAVWLLGSKYTAWK